MKLSDPMAVDPRSPVLVMGASGFLGRHLVRRLLEGSHRVIAVSRTLDSLDDLKHPRLTGIAADMEMELPPIERGTRVIHLAALRVGARESRERYFAVNHDATLRLADRALAAEASRFINVSTAVVLGPSQDAPLDETGEVGRMDHRNAYIASKAAAFLGLERMVGDGLPLITLMPGIVYGPDHASRPNRVTSHIRRILSSPVRIHIGHADGVRSLAFVDDVIDAMLQALERPIPPGSRFLLAGENASMRQLEELVFELSGKPATPAIRVPPALARTAARVADRLGRRRSGEGYAAQIENLEHEWRFDSRRAQQFLDYRPTPLRIGVRMTIECLKQSGGDR